jgi:hypothetical protein
MKSTLHLFIIWQTSLNKKDIVLKDLEEKYVIREVYEVTWIKDDFRNNLKRFYGDKLHNASEKVDLCGNGSFLLILITDKNPKLEKKFLDDVNEVEINTNVYNSKMKYRKWIGVNYGLHASNSEEETNHDLILLLDKKINDLEKEIPEKWNGVIKKIESELTGNKKWKSMKQFFNVLNLTTEYVVLRNFDDLPDKILYHDIDILTNNIKNMSSILNEDKSIIGKSPVKVAEKKILIDFRYQQGHHYDEKWCKDILKRRIMTKNGFYIPSNEDYFYTLLHHAMVHKKIEQKYVEKLKEMAIKLEIKIDLKNFKQSEKILKLYMEKMGYHKTTISHKILYKIKQTEIIRLSSVSVFLLKKYGILFLLQKIKQKIIIIKNSN